MHVLFVCSLSTVSTDDIIVSLLSPLDNMDCRAGSTDGLTRTEAEADLGAVEAGQRPRQGEGHQQREHLG